MELEGRCRENEVGSQRLGEDEVGSQSLDLESGTCTSYFIFVYQFELLDLSTCLYKEST